MKPTVALLVPESMLNTVLSAKDRARLESFAQVKHTPLTEANVDALKPLLTGADGCITGWGTCQFTPELLDTAPNLKIMAHSAGSVKPIVCDAVWDRNIRVTSAAAAISYGVAEHALGLMLSAMKRCYWHNDLVHQGQWQNPDEMKKIRELFGITIGVVGAGHVGKYFIRLIKNFEIEDVLVYDPFLTSKQAEELGVRKVDTLEELLPQADVVSIHAPDLPETHHMFNTDRLKLIKDNALLINTARGALIDEKALYHEVKNSRFTVCLDITDPEPPAEDNPLRTLSNVVFTPHIAGATSNNRLRLGQYAVTELERFFTGQPARFPVTKEDLARIA